MKKTVMLSVTGISVGAILLWMATAANIGGLDFFGANDPHGDRTTDVITGTFKPQDLALVYIKFDKSNSNISVQHAIFDSNGAHEADLKEAIENFKLLRVKKKWKEKPNTETLENFEGKLGRFEYTAPTRIFMHVDGGNAKFDKLNQIIFSKYSAFDNKNPVEKNHSFYNSKIETKFISVEGDILSIENRYTRKTRFLRIKKPIKCVRRGTTGRCIVKHWHDYSMNIHIRTGKNHTIPLVVDPDTGNGSDE